jgi:NAD(P)H-dependent flavin oxidoreductase YrpB (nitropropane dioxygenase family)
MPFHTVLTQRLGLAHPIIQAPLADGGDTPELVVAVCEAGALGFIGAAYLTPPHIHEAARAVRARTARPFGINFMAEVDCPDADDAILPFPLQNALTRPLRNAAAKQGRAELLSLWAGQGARLARRQSAASLIARLAHETEAVLHRLVG